MIKQPLNVLFEAMYHGKQSFDGFLQSPMSQNYEVVTLGSSGNRKILKPKENLKIYHKFLNLFLFEHLPINERVVFSYRKGYGAVNAVEKHKQGRYFFQTDISSFFGSIDSTLTRKFVLAGAEKCPIFDIEQHIDRIIDLVCVDGTLPVGFPASAPISNAVLYDFDNKMEQTCVERALSYSRYADDIIISGQTQENLLKLDDLVQDVLTNFASPKFHINRGKTKFFQVGGKVKILGMLILPNGKISPDTNKKRDLEVLLHFYLTDRAKFNERVGELKKRPKERELTDEDCQNFLSGYLNYVDSIDTNYTDKLRRKFGVTTIDMLIHKGFSSKK